MPIDLLILAVIAAFILYRLYLTLGERTGFDESMKENQEKIVSLSKAREQKQDNNRMKDQLKELPPAVRPGIEAIAKQDKEFDLKEFVEGATSAFEVIIESFAKEDLQTLKELLSSDLYDAFESAVQERRDQGLKLENTIVRFESVKLTSAQLSNKIARIGVEFTTEQIPIMRDDKGDIVEGNPQQIDQVVDSWLFERDTRSSDPNWRLVQTED